VKVVVASDFHADWTSLGVSRFDEVRAAAMQAVDHAIAIDAGLFLFPGDLADPDTGGATFRAVGLAIEMALRLVRAGIPSVWIAGNHDVCEDGSGASTLTPLVDVARHFQCIYVAERPAVFYPCNRIESIQGPELAVLCLPFVPASHGVDMTEATRELWKGIPEGTPVLVASHLSIPGIVPGTETTELPRGREVTYPLAETTRAAHRVSGHYHQRQAFDPGDGGPPIYVAGALARLGFGEQDHDPGFIVIDVPNGGG
jgi:DNA repair exonuclease SbcCD nuclease subunit